MSEKPKILLVEDDPNFGTVLGDYLRLHDFEVVHAIDGSVGLHKFKRDEYDLIILDVMMPQKDGFTLAEEISKINYRQTPFIFLTAKGMKEDMLEGYRLGADDFITKPFDSEVLLYKIKAILQRVAGNEEESNNEYQIGSLTYYPEVRELMHDGDVMKLSPKEGKLLELLCESKNELLSRSKALTLIWKDDNYFTSRSMDVYIAKLRKYLKSENDVEILNVHGEGFRLIDRSESNSHPKVKA